MEITLTDTKKSKLLQLAAAKISIKIIKLYVM